MSAIVINRDIQAREFLMVKPVPSGLASRQEFTWSGQTIGATPVELFLPGNEVIVPAPGVNYQLAGSFIIYDVNNPAATEVNSASEVFAGLRFTIRPNGSIVFTQGYNGFNPGAPPTDYSIGMDFLPLPNVPTQQYLRVRIRGTANNTVMFGIFGRLIATPRLR